MRLYGFARIRDAAAIVGASTIGLLLARVIAPRVSDVVNHLPALQTAAHRMTYYNEVLLGQFASYLIAMTLALFGAALWLGVRKALPLAFKGPVAWFVVLAALVAMAVTSIPMAAVGVGLALVAVPYVGAFAGSGLARVRPASRMVPGAFVLACELASFTFASWLSFSPRGHGLYAAYVGGASLLLLSSRMWASRAKRSIDDDALAGAPLLLLSVSAFVRAPSPWLLAIFVAVASAARVWLSLREVRSDARLDERLVAVAAPWALGAIAIVPVGMREMPVVNWAEHEGMHYAWVNSVLHGKLLWADAGLVHGPLRDYAMSLFVLLAGVTVEHMRIGFVLVNLIGLAVLLRVSWPLVQKRLGLQLWCAYLLVAHTPARVIVDYRYRISLGWADLSRNAWATAAMVGALGVLATAGASPRKRFVGGALLGLATLYSQEYGICAFGAVVLATTCDRVFREEGSLVRRLLSAIRALAPFVVGTLCPLLLFFLLYTLRGRGMVLAKTAYESVALVAAGVWGSLPFPVNAGSFLHPYELIIEFVEGERDRRYHDAKIEFILPGAVYLVAGLALLVSAARKRWSERSTLMLALLVFGATSYRVAIAAPDIWHLLSSTVPAILLVVGLGAEVLRFRVRMGRVWIPVGAMAVGISALASVAMGERAGCATKKARLIYTGEDPLPGLTKFHWDDLPRAGDVNVDTESYALATYIRQHTSPRDPIFVSMLMFGGSELYFLADRYNPTRFDTMSEIVNEERQRELLQELRLDPPELIVGLNLEYVGLDVQKFVAQNYAPATDAPGRVWKYLHNLR